MTQDTDNMIDYGKLMQDALRGLMASVLSDIADRGLPGEHHFFITFETGHPGVDIADWMRAEYPDDMTIVIQNWFDNLAVMEDRFAITLNFNNTPEPMVIPFAAVTTFVDPSVEFGLRFDGYDEEEGEDTPSFDSPEEELQSVPKPVEADAASDTSTSQKKDQEGGAKVVSLDQFRKQ